MLKPLRRMYAFLMPYGKQALLALLFIIGTTAADLSLPRLTQTLIDQGVTARDMGTIARIALIMVGMAAAGAALSVLNTILSVRAGEYMAADLRRAIVHKVQSFSFGNLDKLQTGQLLVRATSDINQVQMIVLMSLRILTKAPLLMIGSVFLLIRTSSELALIIFLLLPLIMIIIGLIAVKGRPLFQQVQKKLDRLNQVLQENMAGVRVVKAFVRTDYENQRFAAANQDLTQQTISVMRLFSVIIPTMMFLLNLGMVAAVWFGGRAAIAGDLSVGAVMAFANYMLLATFPMLLLGGMMGPLVAADASAGRILEVLDSEPSIQEQTQTQLPQTKRGHVIFDSVSFEYDGEESEPVLHNISFEALPGEKVAILGATGSGKSSLVHLVPRFYDATQGRIMLDGVDIRQMPLDALRGQIGISLQEAVLFTGTIRDNIRYGRPQASDDEVIAAAKAAQAHDFISNLPEGYDTLVGERGVNFSGGQKQRLAIARSLLIKPQVLILDDSTSAVDVETEIKIEQALESMLANTTSFVIAQRISTVLTADKIIVLDKGQIAAIGTHAELLASSPIYQEIYESQLGNGEVNHG